MCGICVVQKLNGQQVSVDELRAMSSVIRHRGPDGAGFALLDGKSLGLAHVRLSIIDLMSGDQPLSSPDGQVTIVFNGELYDYQDYRDELIEDGFQFQTTSDTEVLLNLYLRDGVECFSKLNGEYAFVIWDSRSLQLYAVKDRFGKKPLYYHKRDDEIFFASEVKSLFTLPRIQRALNADYFVSAVFGTFTADTHVFQGVYSLPAGHYICIENGQWNAPIAYWRPEFRPESSNDCRRSGRRCSGSIDARSPATNGRGCPRGWISEWRN